MHPRNNTETETRAHTHTHTHTHTGEETIPQHAQTKKNEAEGAAVEALDELNAAKTKEVDALNKLIEEKLARVVLKKATALRAKETAAYAAKEKQLSGDIDII